MQRSMKVRIVRVRSRTLPKVPHTRRPDARVTTNVVSPGAMPGLAECTGLRRRGGG